MGEQRKNLQDIYDAGSSRLEKLEQSQRQALQQSKTQGLENISQIESSMSDQMEVSQADLESEIRAYLDKAVEGIDAAVKSEIEENGKFLERLQDTLKLTCRSISADVKHLSESVVNKFNVSADHCLTLQRCELDNKIGQLYGEGCLAAAQLKEISQSGNTEFNSRAAEHVLQALEKGGQAPAVLVAEFSRQAVSIDKRTNDCAELLASRSKEIIAEITGAGQGVQTSVEQLVQKLSGQMEESYRNSESRLSGHCEDALSAALIHQEELASGLAGDILNSEHLSPSGIEDKLQSLKSSTDSLLTEVKQFLSDVDAGVRQDCDRLMQTFSQSLEGRLEDARNRNLMVADERKQLMVRIGADLKNIEIDFESRLSRLAERCQTKLSSVCVEAEVAIVSAHDSCAAEFKALSSQQHQAVEDKTQRLLQDIDRLRQQAITNIKTAAGENAAAQGQGQSASPDSDLDISDGTGNPFGDFGDLKL